MKTCPNCSAPIDDDAKFCVYCGTKFENKSCCPQCGSIIVHGTKFCTCCGTKIQSISSSVQEEQVLKAGKENAELERLRRDRGETEKAEQERKRNEKLQEERRRASVAREEKRRLEAEKEKKTTRITIVVMLSFILALGVGIIYFASPTKSGVSVEKTRKRSSNASKSVYNYENNEYYDSNESYDDDNTTNYSDSSSFNSVDLGLSVLWADRNIGALSVTDDGWLIGWGTTDYQNTSKKLSEYPTSNPPFSISQTSYDIAKTMYGGRWRLPSLSELKELKDECTWEVVNESGINVYKVTGPSGNSIYLPFAGYRDGTELKQERTWGFIWSGELYEGNSQFGANLAFNVNGKVSTSGFYRYGGESIRPVMSK